MTGIAVIALAVLLSVPVVAAVLVSGASRREDRERALAGCAPGPVQEAARRIVASGSEGRDWLNAAASAGSGPASARPYPRRSGTMLGVAP